MLKFLTIGILLYLFYRLMDNPGRIEPPDQYEELEDGDDDFIDYEEIE